MPDGTGPGTRCRDGDGRGRGPAGAVCACGTPPACGGCTFSAASCASRTERIHSRSHGCTVTDVVGVVVVAVEDVAAADAADDDGAPAPGPVCAKTGTSAPASGWHAAAAQCCRTHRTDRRRSRTTSATHRSTGTRWHCPASGCASASGACRPSGSAARTCATMVARNVALHGWRAVR